MRVELAGYAPVEQRLAIEREQNVLIPLAALPAPPMLPAAVTAPAPAPAAPAKPPPKHAKPKTSDPFQRFD